MTQIYINKGYGEREGVASLAHEIQHTYLYFKGLPWKEDSPGFKERANNAQDKAYQNYDKLHKK